MKKCLILAAACVFVLALAMPAMAELKITGATSMDLYWFELSAENVAGGVAAGATTPQNDREEFHMNLRMPSNYVNFAYTNDDATLGGVLRIRGGSYDHSNGVFGGANGDQVQFMYSYIWWKPAPATRIIIGQQDQIVGGLAPAVENLGKQDPAGVGGTVGINYGNLHGTERAGIVIDQTINKNIGMQFGIYDPENDNDAVNGAALPASVAGATVREELTWPRFDIGFPIKFANFQTKPKGSFMTKEYDQVAGGSEDSFDIWVASIDAKVSFGPLELSGEYSTGENLSEANYVGLTGDAALRTRNYIVPGTASTRFADTEHDLWWVQAKYQFSKALGIYAAYGETQSENEADPSVANDNWDIETSYWGVILEYKVLPNFILYPTYASYDDGDDNLRAGVRTDNGEEEVYGVKFVLLW